MFFDTILSMLNIDSKGVGLVFLFSMASLLYYHLHMREHPGKAPPLSFFNQIELQSQHVLIKNNSSSVFYSHFFRSDNLTLFYLILSPASSSNGSAPLESSDGQSGSDTPVRTLASGSSSAPETSPSASSDRNSASASGAAATRQPSSSITPAVPPRVPAVNAGPLPPGSALMMSSLQKGILACH